MGVSVCGLAQRLSLLCPVARVAQVVAQGVAMVRPLPREALLLRLPLWLSPVVPAQVLARRRKSLAR